MSAHEASEGMLRRPLWERVARWRVEGSIVLAGLLLVGFALLVVPPLLVLLRTSVGQVGIDGVVRGWTFTNYESVVTQQGLATALVNTVLFAAGSILVALVLGGLQAWIVERTNTPLTSLSFIGAIFSLSIPFVLYTIAWLLLLGKGGPLNQWILPSLAPGTIFNVYSLVGMILIEGFLWSPLAFLMLSPIFSSMDAELEEAASINGAGALQTLARVTGPLALPSIAAIALLGFTRAIEAFEIPGLVGLPGRVMVLTTRIFLNIDGRTPPDYGGAAAFSAILVLLVVFLLFGYRRLTQHAERFATVTGRRRRAAKIDLGRWRYLTAAVLVVNFLLVVVLPLSILMWASLLPFYELPSQEAFSRITLQNFVRVTTFPKYLNWIGNTLLAAAVTALVVSLSTAAAGWLAARRRPGGRLLDQLGTVPLIFPGIVLAVALLSIFLSVPMGVYGTLWILIIAYCIRLLPYGMRYGYSGALQIHGELEEAGLASGASVLGTLRRITIPLIRPSLIAGGLFVFLLAARDLSMSVLLASPRTGVVAVVLFDLWGNGQANELAAFGLAWSVVMAAIASVLYILARRYGIRLY